MHFYAKIPGPERKLGHDTALGANHGEALGTAGAAALVGASRTSDAARRGRGTPC